MINPILSKRFGIAILLTSVWLNSAALPQKKEDAPPRSFLCSRDNGLEMIEQQIAGSKTFDESVPRIALLIRAADLLWPYRQDKARLAFTESLDLAIQNFKEKGDEPGRQGRLSVYVPDQRFMVIAAIAKRDPVWARKLSDRLLEENAKDAEDKSTKDPRQDAKAAEKLMNVAFSLLPSDPTAAVGFARSSLRHTATLSVPGFLYRLWAINKSLADQFYQDALGAYANSPMDQFLYLSSYPFGNNREAGEMPAYMFYAVPEGFIPNPSLQRLFMQTLLRRAQQLVENPTEPIPGSRYSEAGQMWMALTRLEAPVQTSSPDLIPALQQAKAGVSALLSQKDQQRVAQTLEEPPKQSFDERIEAALKQSDPARRESGIALAIMSAPDAESLDHVIAAADKIDDSQLRAQVLSRLYFNRAQTAIKDKRLEEARRLAAKVDELDQRAYLYSQIVADAIKQARNEFEIREILEEVVSATAKAPDTEVKARALLGVAFLYAQVDPNRSVAVLGDAVKSINRIEAPDFSSDYVIKRIEGKEFGSYYTLKTPGLNPENAFREMSKLDFDGTLYQAGYFSNKPLRSMTTLALVEPCLQKAPQTKVRSSKP